MCAWNIDGPYCDCAGVCSAIMNCIMWQEIDGRYKQNFSKLNVENRSKLSIFLSIGILENSEWVYIQQIKINFIFEYF